MRLVSTQNTVGFARVELEQQPEGIYVFVWERANSSAPDRDYLQDTWDIAKSQCSADFGIPPDSWEETA